MFSGILPKITDITIPNQIEQLNRVQKGTLENQYYAPNILAEIAQRQAQTNKLNVMTPLEAAYQQQVNQYYGPGQRADIGYKNALTSAIPSEIGLRNAQSALASSEAAKNKYMQEHPGYMGGETAKQLQYLMDAGIINPNQLKSMPNTSTNINPMGSMPSPINNLSTPNISATPFNTGNTMVDAILNKGYAQPAYQQLMARSFNWAHTPVDAKNYQIAQLAGAGVDPSEAIGELSSGKTVPQILQEKGFDPSNPPTPDFLPTKGNIQQLKQRQSALNEVKYLGNFITKGLGPYSQTIFGFSPAQVSDALRGMNKQQQIDFLAARGLAPELTNLRLLLAQAKSTVSAQKSMADKSMTNINAYQSLVTPEIWEAVQNKMDEKLSNAFEKANEAYQVGRNNKEEKENNENTIKVDWDEHGNLVRK